MTARNSTNRRKHRKDFPLFQHARGYWARKVRGKTRYFGRIDGDELGQAAIERWLKLKDGLLAGLEPAQIEVGALTVQNLCDSFLAAKERLVDAGELSSRSFDDYKATAIRVADSFGRPTPVDVLTPDRFEPLRAEIAKVYGLHRTATEIQRVRTIFKYAYDAGFVEKPVRFGPTFKRPPKRAFRIHKAENNKLLAANEIWRVMENASDQLKAMILLGINCGFGNQDCMLLPITAVDLIGGWIEWHRPKTGIMRRCALWSETVEAIKSVLAKRAPTSSVELKDVLFLTKYRKPWSRHAIAHELTEAKLAAGISDERFTFYWLRHTFKTIAEESGDESATEFVMGHVADGISANYRQRFSDDRLQAVAAHVRGWLLKGKPKRKPRKSSGKGGAA